MARSSPTLTSHPGGAIRQPERWRRARQVFELALEQDPERRDAFVHGSTGGDRRLRREVEDLLAAHDKAGALDRPIFDLLPPTRLEALAPERLGPYRLERLLGCGGMGSVHLARRVDGELEQEVAIKVLRSDAATPQLAGRFRRERQILARLHHPHLTRLLDAGTTGDGRPYFVMERVDGIPLDRWMEGSEPTLRRRLDLFLGICDAVHHAHEHGVVHRDLKPGNILVDQEQQPHVLDFGVAAFLAASWQEAGGDPLTETAGAPMTLRYASPEQLAGSAVGPQADVYSLGVLLFELLTGASPYGPQPTPQRVMKDLLHGELPPPSSVTGPWPRRLRGDLDAVVVKCLCRRPEERYENAGAIAGDLRAHLGGRPIAARRSLLYRQGRHLRSNAKALTAAALVMLSLATWWGQHRRLGEHRLEAGRAADDTAETLAQMGGTLARDGRAEEARRLLEEAVSLRSRLVVRGPGSPPAGGEILARNLGALGDLQLQQGDYAEAVRSHRRSLALLDSGDSKGHPQLALSLTSLGLAEARRGDFASGERSLLKGLDLARSLVTEAPKTKSRTLHDYGRYLSDRGAFEAASRVFGQALGLAQDLFADSDPELLSLRLDAAAAAAGRGHYAEANSHLEAASFGLAELPENHPMRLFDLERRAFLAFVDSRYDQAEHDARQAMSGAVERFGPVHPSVHAARRTLCQVLRDLGRHREANAECAATVQLAAELHGPDHPLVGDALVMQAEALEPLDRPSAMNLLTQAHETYLRSIGERHPMVARIFHYRSLERLVAGDHETADQHHRRAVRIYLETVGDGHPNLAYAYQQYAGMLSRLGRAEDATACYGRAIKAMAKGLGADHPRLVWLHAQLAAHLVSHRLGGEEAARRALELSAGASFSAGTAVAMASLTRALELQGRADEGRRVEAELRASRPEMPVTMRQQLARLYDRWNQPEAVSFWRAPTPAAAPAEFRR